MLRLKAVSNNTLPAWPLLPALLLACLLNYYSFKFFAGVELIFGNVIAVILLFTYGVLPAAIIATAAGVATYLGFGHFFSIPSSIFEILALYWAIRTQRNPLYIGMLYWVFIGGGLVALEFLFLSDFESSPTYPIIVKHVINGLLTILVGYSVAQFIVANKWGGKFAARQKISVLLTNRIYYIVTVAVVIISFFWLKAFEREELSDYQQRLQMKANYVSASVEQQIAGHQRSLILSALNNHNVTDLSEIQQILVRLENLHPAITTLLSTDKDGLLTASAPTGLLAKVSPNEDLNVADRPYFYEVKRNRKPFISDVFLGRGFGTASIIAISVPLQNDKGFVGILEASLDITLLNDLDKKEIVPEEGLIILDRNDRVIYASNSLNYEFFADLSDSKLVEHLSVGDQYDVKDELGNHLIVESATSELLGWRVISTLPVSVYDASIDDYMSITLLLLSLFIIFSFHIVKWALLKVTKPINAFSDAISNAKNAEDLLALTSNSENQQLIEISQVEKKLNSFAVRAQELVSELKIASINQDIANEQLHDLNENLEEIVESKTQELNSALRIANNANDEKDRAKEVAERAARGKTDFLATMSHEIRTPMNGVLGMAELLSETPLTVPQKDYVDSILNSGNLLLTIINDVLVYSKLEAGKVELEIVPMNLEYLLHEVLEVMSGSLNKDIQLVLDYPPTMPAVFMGDPARLSQVLFNLVDNAIKFTEQGSVTIQARFNRERLALTVSDTGIGITEKQQGLLFESFNQADTSTTRKYGGTGLGLAISKQIIDLMEGEIKIESEHNKGSSFIIDLGLVAEKRPEPEKRLSELNVLLIESDQKQLVICSKLLRHYGASVIQCLDVASGIDLLLTRSAQERGIDLVLISNNSLLGQEHQYGNMLRDHPKLSHTPLVVLSPSNDKTSLDHYLESGFSAYLTKPIRSDLLISILKAALEKKDPSSLITKHTLPSYPKASPVKSQFSGHVLLVEDVLTNRVVATTMLSGMGVTYDIAEDGLQAISQWNNHHYDLIFMDCRMPNMDGYEATRLIREKEIGREIPIIALTANVTEADRIKCQESGMNAVVMKPYKHADLRAVLSEWLPSNSNVVVSPELDQADSDADAGAAIDLELFTNTQQLLGDSFPELVESIFNDIDTILDKLSNWTDSQDLDGLALLPHSMKSTSAYIGATRLNRLAANCEADARKGNVDTALSSVKDMRLAYDDVISELAELGYNKSS